jgi:hypothetical protein
MITYDNALYRQRRERLRPDPSTGSRKYVESWRGEMAEWRCSLNVDM